MVFQVASKYLQKEFANFTDRSLPQKTGITRQSDMSGNRLPGLDSVPMA
jgi:hypothetical protein